MKGPSRLTLFSEACYKPVVARLSSGSPPTRRRLEAAPARLRPAAVSTDPPGTFQDSSPLRNGRRSMTAAVRVQVLAIASATLVLTATILAQSPATTIRAGTVLDGKGGVMRNAELVIDGSKILKVGTAG